MAGGWNDALLHIVNSGVSATAGVGVAWLYERWKRIRLAADDWRIWYSFEGAEDGSTVEQPPPDKPIKSIGYGFTARLFSEKTAAVGLHRFAVLFTKGKGRTRKVLIRDEDVHHVGQFIRQCRKVAGPLKQMTLQPKLWTVEELSGHIGEATAAGVRQADGVWLTAETADGKSFQWHVTNLRPAG
jgi:hypothetical protein